MCVPFCCPCADILESIFAAAPAPTTSGSQALTEAASGSDLLQAGLVHSPSAAAAAAAALQQQAGLQGAAAAAAAGLGVSAADMESLVSLAAKQAAKEEELAAARTQVSKGSPAEALVLAVLLPQL